MGGLRPTKELSQYTVPGVHGLYLAGAFMHPGGGVTGGGRATAIRILEDMELARRHLTPDAQTLA
jgi:phytoene dehydrogenase-like protein